MGEGRPRPSAVGNMPVGNAPLPPGHRMAGGGSFKTPYRLLRCPASAGHRSWPLTVPRHPPGKGRKFQKAISILPSFATGVRG
jgi:hypothetical protein